MLLRKKTKSLIVVSLAIIGLASTSIVNARSLIASNTSLVQIESKGTHPTGSVTKGNYTVNSSILTKPSMGQAAARGILTVGSPKPAKDMGLSMTLWGTEYSLIAATPYYYSVYGGPETENEAVATSDKKKVLVLGSGPIRIGQGIEFDFCSVHCTWAFKKEGYETIIINNNPETVSTDFDIADRLYFEPLTAEDVESIVDIEKPDGAIVQFGGQTAIKLTKALTDMGVKILGTDADDVDAAEDRERFDEILEKCHIDRPRGSTVFTTEEAIEVANKLGYPVLVRPSYVLGGAGMEIALNDGDIKKFMKIINRQYQEHPILIDKYLSGKEVEVDAVCDGHGILIPGIMEHIERAGVHSGDSMAVYPPQTLSKKIQETIADYTKRLAIGLNCIGMMNIQFVIKDETVYVIEVNPRASRTVPFLSKVTDIPMAQVATNLILGKSLAEQGYKDGLYPESKHVHVKAPVFSFTKLAKVDSLLGPEMKSTGEVMGTDATLEKALYKAFEASYLHLPTFGNVIFTIHDDTKEEALDLARRFDAIGYGIYATEGTAKFLNEHGVHATLVNKLGENDDNDIPALVRTGKAQAIINTVGNKRTYDEDGAAIRSSAIEAGIPLFTALDTADAMVRVLESRSFTTEAI